MNSMQYAMVFVVLAIPLAAEETIPENGELLLQTLREKDAAYANGVTISGRIVESAPEAGLGDTTYGFRYHLASRQMGAIVRTATKVPQILNLEELLKWREKEGRFRLSADDNLEVSVESVAYRNELMSAFAARDITFPVQCAGQTIEAARKNLSKTKNGVGKIRIEKPKPGLPQWEFHWGFGRGFSWVLQSIEAIEVRNDGMLYAQGKGGYFGHDTTFCTWKLIVDPKEDYLVRHAICYPDRDAKALELFGPWEIEVTTSGLVTRNDGEVIAKDATLLWNPYLRKRVTLFVSSADPDDNIQTDMEALRQDYFVPPYLAFDGSPLFVSENNFHKWTN